MLNEQHRARPVAETRMAELEMRLRRIGAEVAAAGVLLEGNGKPVVDEISAVEDLTARQREVLDLFVEGQRVSMIADRLFLSRSTVRNHLATIFQKLGVHTQAELIALLRHPTA